MLTFIICLLLLQHAYPYVPLENVYNYTLALDRFQSMSQVIKAKINEIPSNWHNDNQVLDNIRRAVKIIEDLHRALASVSKNERKQTSFPLCCSKNKPASAVYTGSNFTCYFGNNVFNEWHDLQPLYRLSATLRVYEIEKFGNGIMFPAKRSCLNKNVLSKWVVNHLLAKPHDFVIVISRVWQPGLKFLYRFIHSLHKFDQITISCGPSCTLTSHCFANQFVAADLALRHAMARFVERLQFNVSLDVSDLLVDAIERLQRRGSGRDALILLAGNSRDRTFVENHAEAFCSVLDKNLENSTRKITVLHYVLGKDPCGRTSVGNLCKYTSASLIYRIIVMENWRQSESWNLRKQLTLNKEMLRILLPSKSIFDGAPVITSCLILINSALCLDSDWQFLTSLLGHLDYNEFSVQYAVVFDELGHVIFHPKISRNFLPDIMISDIEEELTNSSEVLIKRIRHSTNSVRHSAGKKMFLCKRLINWVLIFCHVSIRSSHRSLSKEAPVASSRTQTVLEVIRPASLKFPCQYFGTKISALETSRFTSQELAYNKTFEINPNITMSLHNLLMSVWNWLPHVTWRHFISQDSQILSYPSTKSTIMSLTKTTWYQAAVHDAPAAYVSMPVINKYGAGILNTISLALFNKRNVLWGVVSAEVSSSWLYHRVIEATPVCRSKEYFCSVIDAHGFLIMHKDFVYRPWLEIEKVHIISREPSIAEVLIKHQVLISNSCYDIQLHRKILSWKVVLTKVFRTRWIDIHAIPHSKLFLIAKHERLPVKHSCSCTSTMDEICNQKRCQCPCTLNDSFKCNSSTQTFSHGKICNNLATSHETIHRTSNNASLSRCRLVQCSQFKNQANCENAVSCSWCQHNIMGKLLPTPFCTQDLVCHRSYQSLRPTGKIPPPIINSKNIKASSMLHTGRVAACVVASVIGFELLMVLGCYLGHARRPLLQKICKYCSFQNLSGNTRNSDSYLAGFTNPAYSDSVDTTA